MATINYYLDHRSVRADGTSPLKISINSAKKSTLVSTGVFLEKNQWDVKSKMVVKHPKKVILNQFLQGLFYKIEQACFDKQYQTCRALTNAQVKSIVASFFQENPKSENSIESVFNGRINDEGKKPRTRELYSITLSKVKTFMGKGWKNAQFEDITPAWLEKFDRWMAINCKSFNGRAIHLRNLRTVMNKAIDEDITKSYPFRKFKIKTEPTRKRALSVKQLRVLHEFPLEDWQKKYVDTFFLMFYLMGINAVDLLNAKPEQVIDGRLEYKRAKTGTLYSIKLEPEALEIIHRYKGKKHLLKFCDTSNYKHFMKRMNMCLDSIIPGCTSYYARHSVASIAAELDVPLDLIARMLGHTDTTRKVTLVYIDYNQKKVDKANRKVIDWMLYKKNN